MPRISRRSFIVSGGIGLAAASGVRAQMKEVKRDENCPFCKIVAGTLSAHKLWEDKHFVAFLSHKPITPGHTLLIPKDHYPYLFDIPEKVYYGIMARTRKLSAPIQAAMGSKRIGVLVEGFGVNHCHVHLVPINGSNELTKKGVEGVSDADFSCVATKIRAQIREGKGAGRI